jgi:hypothetical protein
MSNPNATYERDDEPGTFRSNDDIQGLLIHKDSVSDNSSKVKNKRVMKGAIVVTALLAGAIIPLSMYASSEYKANQYEQQYQEFLAMNGKSYAT